MRRLLTAASYAGSTFHVSPVAEWQQGVSSTACPHLPFTPPIAVYSCSIKLFHLKIGLGLALGKSWLLLAQPLNHTRVQSLPLPIFVGKLSVGKPT